MCTRIMMRPSGINCCAPKRFSSFNCNQVFRMTQDSLTPSPPPHPRLVREEKTISAMVHIHCQGQGHLPAEGKVGEGRLCQDCQELLDYALERLEQCPFQEKKSTCAHCTVHCYKPDRREQTRKVMRYSGPRMLLKHPILTIRHLLDGVLHKPGKP